MLYSWSIGQFTNRVWYIVPGHLVLSIGDLLRCDFDILVAIPGQFNQIEIYTIKTTRFRKRQRIS